MVRKLAAGNWKMNGSLAALSDLPAMAAAVDGKTKLVIVCNPNNPTGAVLSEPEMDAIVATRPENAAVMPGRPRIVPHGVDTARFTPAWTWAHRSPWPTEPRRLGPIRSFAPSAIRPSPIPA